MTESRNDSDRAKTVAQNFIKQYGRPKFLRLIEMLLANEPGPKIAHEFSVTRQRVHQWKVQLGHEQVVFNLHPAIESLLGVVVAGRKTV